MKREKNSETDKVYRSIISLYADGTIYKMLSNYDNVKITVSSNKEPLQLSYSFQNMNVGIDFSRSGYSYVIYPTGANFDKLSRSFIDEEYEEGFSVSKLFASIHSQLMNSKDLTDISEKKRKKKKYKLISNISILLAIIAVGIAVGFVLITGKEVTLNFYWLLLLVIIPLVVSLIFDIMASK